MKIVELNSLHDPAMTAPFYAVIDELKKNEDDPRACSCASLAILNAVLVLKDRLKIKDDLTPYAELMEIKKKTNERLNAVMPIDMLEYIDQHPIFKNCRMLIMNPNAMNEEVFLKIFLNRLSQGHIFLALMEIPSKPGDLASDTPNHASFIHSESGEVYLDSLRVDFNFLIKALFFSRSTTIIMIGANKVGSYE